MNEDDTFEVLKRMPFNELYQKVIDSKFHPEKDLGEIIKLCGWELSEFEKYEQKLWNVISGG
jgi:hypothetical protein